VTARSRDERGGVFVVAAFVMALGMLLVLATGPLVGAVVLRARAGAAADAAALAAADQIALGRPDRACAVAATVARANGSRLETCSTGPRHAAVTVGIDPPMPAMPHVRARARAEIDWSLA
jgi:secretion/DNA translocation related TadE-like protein